MKQYLDLMERILLEGALKSNRTGVDTLNLFGTQMRFNLADGFPLLTTKKVHLKSIIHELLWLISGSTNIKYLNDNGVTIWDAWADKEGSVGPSYGFHWRSWPLYATHEDGLGGSIDQLQNSLDTLKQNPNCRRNIVSAWNVPYLDKMGLPPCHLLFQFDVVDNKLSCHLYQRSCDFFLGVPFNLASYALLTMMMARMSNLELGEFIWTGSSTHIYNNHIEQAKLQLSREPKTLPTMEIDYHGQGLDDWKYEDFNLIDYNPHPAIKAKVAV